AAGKIDHSRALDQRVGVEPNPRVVVHLRVRQHHPADVDGIVETATAGRIDADRLDDEIGRRHRRGDEYPGRNMQEAADVHAAHHIAVDEGVAADAEELVGGERAARVQRAEASGVAAEAYAEPGRGP